MGFKKFEYKEVEGGISVALYGDDAEVVVPSEIDGKKVVDIYCFGYNSTLISVVIPEGVKSIGDYTFSEATALESVVIPDSVTSIGHGIFEQCFSLKSVTIGKGNNNYCVVDGGIYNKDKTVLLECCYCNNGNFVMPESVKIIGEYAFQDRSQLRSINTSGDEIDEGVVKIPNGVTSIEYGAFERCVTINSVELPDSVTSIADRAFSDCHNLSSVVFSKNITELGRNAFANCRLTVGPKMDLEEIKTKIRELKKAEKEAGKKRK